MLFNTQNIREKYRTETNKKGFYNSEDKATDQDFMLFLLSRLKIAKSYS